jgi:hypothetical protein
LRKRNAVRERINEVEQDSWMCGKAKKGHERAGVAAGDRQRDVAASSDGGTTWRGGEKPTGFGRAAGR